MIMPKAIKICLLGPAYSGKSAICGAFLNVENPTNTISTIGSEKIEKKIKLKNGNDIKVIIWDTSGQERFSSTAIKLIQYAHRVIINFSVKEEGNFKSACKWFEDTKEFSN